MDDASYDAMAAVVARVEQQSKSSRDLIRTNGSSKRVVAGAHSTSSSNDSTSEPTPSTSGSILGKRSTEEDSNEEKAVSKAKTETASATVNESACDGTVDVSAAQCTDGYCVPCYELM